MESETAEQNRKARQREYYLKHREKMLAYSRRYLQEHPEKKKLYQENAARKRADGTGYYQRLLSAPQGKIAGKLQAMAPESPRKGEGIPAQILSEENCSQEREGKTESGHR